MNRIAGKKALTRPEPDPKSEVEGGRMEIGPLQKEMQTLAVAPVSTPPEIVARNRELIQAVKSINAAEHFGTDSELTFVLDRQTQRPIIRVVNRDTKEVIQQIPPQYVLELARRSKGSSP
jgi:uncharacterized FlaG/YvyC family protein